MMRRRPVPFLTRNPRSECYAKGLVTAARNGAQARERGQPAAANPYRGTEHHVAWREGWQSKDRELGRP